MIVIKGVSKTFNGSKILEDLFFTLETGRITCILGPSGSGKTTTLQLLAGLLQADKGTISGLQGLPISYVFQEPRLLPWETVEGNMEFVLKNQIAMPQRQKVIECYLELMGLTAYRNYYPHTLSGGMKQRLALCRAFAFPHQLLLMDEPFKSLDTPLKISLLQEVAKMWHINQNTILFVTHDIAEGLLLGHKLLVYSNKPTSVQREFLLDDPLCQRDLSSPTLTKLYSEITRLLKN
ncbi:ABC transporter related protein [Desulforamulus reducens MI-1]|uniref:ABC transporter related protein n=1 Tax=Desulforamulus reducens (strain ATCC BAA-1160 / DSM 100696 / MI-1) TaxID=349161 RepID=A4J1N2_DESRM|nr:ABC transporter ATP-binding protein [Desulforamulus reducens]ABO48985.1 ABC transporter related protein [Desulforamulus reducens MI-1]